MTSSRLLHHACLLLAAGSSTVQADPQISSWLTAHSSQYARLVETDAELAAGSSKTTWTRTSGPNTTTQALPVYAGPQQIDYSASWVYVKTPDLATYLMGPWYDNAAKSALFVNIPKNQNLTVRFPRTATLGAIPSTKTSTLGLNIGGVMQDAVGWYVDGVALFDPMDGYSYSGGTEASPGTGQWHRDAYVNEQVTFDKSFAHQQNTGKYHNHANPYALRYQLGDNVLYNATSKSYAEGDTTTPAVHSPIIGWMLDGLPLYGPYGYSEPLNPASPVRRMKGGFVKRDGTTTGVDNITTAGRTLPAWVLRNNGNTAATGPAVSTTYPLGRYIEDNAYLGDLIKTGTTKYLLGTDFDLNEYNVRYCVTPEFPNGTWAYFANITATGLPQFPYLLNRWFYGTPTGGVVSTVAETVTNSFKGGENLVETAQAPTVNAATGTVTFAWSSVEGGTYLVEASNDLATWSVLNTAQTATAFSPTTSYQETADVSNLRRFYRTIRTSLATYDTGTTTGGTTEGVSAVTPTSGARGSPATLTVTLNTAYSPAPPPNNVAPTSASLTRTGAATINATTYTRNSSTGVVTLTFTIPAGATTGAYNVNVVFGANTWSKANAFTVN